MQKEKNLLKRFLKSKASKKEIEDVEGWLDNAASDHNEWAQLSKENKAALMQDMWADINKRITSKNRTSKWYNKKIVWAAASLILLLTIPVYYLWENTSGNQNLVENKRWLTVTTGIGEVKEILLKDGSKVWLNAKSQLSYAEEFDGKTRDVRLKGQAYFDIMRNAKKPFIVHAQSLNITVLGTCFDISDYKEDINASVAVLSGKIAVHKPQNRHSAIVLEIGERIKLNKNRQEIVKENFKPTQFPAWVNKRVVFYHTPMKEVANMLQRNYNMHFHFTDKMIETLEISGDFGSVEHIENILSMICLSINVDYKISGNEIVVKPLD